MLELCSVHFSTLLAVRIIGNPLENQAWMNRSYLNRLYTYSIKFRTLVSDGKKYNCPIVSKPLIVISFQASLQVWRSFQIRNHYWAPLHKTFCRSFWRQKSGNSGKKKSIAICIEICQSFLWHKKLRQKVLCNGGPDLSLALVSESSAMINRFDMI